MDYQAVIVNAILHTEISLVSACEKLTGAAVQEIHIMVTHGLFTGTRWKELWSLGVKRTFSDLLQIVPGGAERPAVFRVELRSDAKQGMNESALPDHIALRQPPDLPFRIRCIASYRRLSFS